MKQLFAALLFLITACNTKAGNDLLTTAKEALAFCQEKGYSTNFCVLIDMSIHSGKYRLFVWDFAQNKATEKGLCSHGCCDSPWGTDETKTNPVFKNVNGSHCSSLGKYKIGKRGYSNWGINVNYKLHGLESTNKKAYERLIVLHSWNEVPTEETYPNGTPEGWGCPAVSNQLMQTLDKKLKAEGKPVLLWVYQ